VAVCTGNQALMANLDGTGIHVDGPLPGQTSSAANDRFFLPACLGYKPGGGFRAERVRLGCHAGPRRSCRNASAPALIGKIGNCSRRLQQAAKDGHADSTSKSAPPGRPSWTGRPFLFFALQSADINRAAKKAEAAMKRHEKVIETAIDGFLGDRQWPAFPAGRSTRPMPTYSGYSISELVRPCTSVQALRRNERPERRQGGPQWRKRYSAAGPTTVSRPGHRPQGRLASSDIEVSVKYQEEKRAFLFRFLGPRTFNTAQSAGRKQAG